MAFSGRFTRWIPLLIVSVVDFLIFVSVLYFVPSSSPYYTPLYFIVDALTFAAIILTAQSDRFKTGFRRKVIYRSKNAKPNFIYSNIIDDLDTDIYKQKLKEASDLYLQGKINSEEEFFEAVGEHTPKEDRIFQVLKRAREELKKM